MRNPLASSTHSLTFNLSKTLSSSPPHSILLHGHVIITPLLRHCSKTLSLSTTKALHALTITLGPRVPQPIFATNVIVSSYARLGQLCTARYKFDEMPERNVVSYNTMIGAYARSDNVNKAWEMFFGMRVCGFEPTQFTYGGLLSCPSLGLARGAYLQALIAKSGFLYSDAYAGTALLALFGRNGCLDDAYRAFEDMPEKNLVTWNTMISILSNHGFSRQSMFMFRELMRIGEGLSEYSYVGVLSGFRLDQDVELGEQIHGLLMKNGLLYQVEIANAMLSMYIKCCGAQVGEKMFDGDLVQDTVSWNTIIGAFSKSDTPMKALEYFLRMFRFGALPSGATFASVINACTSLRILIVGTYVHAKVIKYLFQSDVYVGSSLVDFYAKFGELEDAHRCFRAIDEKNVVCWNALISGYSDNKNLSSVTLFKEMIQSGYLPNEFSLSAVLKSTFTLELLQLHSLIIKLGYQKNEHVYCSLMTSFAKNGFISEALLLVPANESPLPVVPCNVVAGLYNKTGQYHKAQELYSELEDPDIVSWNILLAACARNGDYKEVFELFKHMQVDYIYPDKYTYVSLFSVCTKTCNLVLGSSLHGLILKTDPVLYDTFVYNIMIDMYGKCGSLISSLKLFDEILEKDFISWTVLISVLGIHGHAEEALRKFKEMEVNGFKPDGVAFLTVLSACRHGGLVKEGKEIFEKMKTSYGIEPSMDHYHVMVDLLTRCGKLKEAEKLVLSMPFLPNARIWRCFLEGCERQRSAPVVRIVEDMDLECSG